MDDRALTASTPAPHRPPYRRIPQPVGAAWVLHRADCEPSRAEYARHLADGPLDGRHVFETAHGEDDVEACVCERHCLRPPDDESEGGIVADDGARGPDDRRGAV